MKFYSVIIGTELLNGRRVDKHFDFLNKELLKRGWEQTASFVIKDEPNLIKDVFRFVKNDKDSVLFSFGGIGATPDDLTRQCVADVWSNGVLEVNQKAKDMIVDRFKDEAYPYRIQMADLPPKSKLLKNIITNVPGFYLQDRYFFMPGFPSMSQNMIIQALDLYYPTNNAKYRLSLKAKTSEHTLMGIMNKIPKNIDFSSLPIIDGDKREVVIEVVNSDKNEAEKYFNIFVEFLDTNKIAYDVGAF